MSSNIDPFADEVREHVGAQEDVVVNNRLGMSNVRQALGRWWLMLVFGVLGYVGALYCMSISPPSSEAIAVVELEITEKKLIGQGLTKEQRNTPEVKLATVTSKMNSMTILSEVANSPEVQALQSVMPPKFSLLPRYWRTEEELRYKPASSVESHELVKMIFGGIKISPRRGTLLIDISMKHADPDSARVIVDAMLKVYLDKEESQLAGGSIKSYQILKDESELAKESIRSADRSLQVYVSALELNEQIKVQYEFLQNLRRRYKAKYPKLIRQEAVFADLFKRFNREIERSTEDVNEKGYWVEHKDALAELSEKVSAGADEAKDAADEWLAIAQNALSSRASALHSVIKREQKQFEILTIRMTEIDLADNNKLNKLKVVEPAFIGISKDSVRLVYLAVGSIFGAIAGFAIAYALSVIDYKVYDVRSAEEATGLTCMAAVPASSKFDAPGDWESILTMDPASANSEAIRNLRASIVLLGKQERNKVLLVTSSIPGEGKTTMSAEIAASFAMNKERTLLIDMDLRRPRLTDKFPGVKGQLGIVDVFAGQCRIEEVFHDTNIPLLTVVGSGSKCPNPSELLHEDDFVELLDQLTSKFDRIIIDSAPVLPVADSRLLSKHVHKVILVVRSRKTPIGAVIRSKSLIEMSDGKIAGVVVNGMKRSAGGSYFNGYKGYGEYGADDYGYYGDSE